MSYRPARDYRPHYATVMGYSDEDEVIILDVDGFGLVGRMCGADLLSDEYPDGTDEGFPGGTRVFYYTNAGPLADEYTEDWR